MEEWVSGGVEEFEDGGGAGGAEAEDAGAGFAKRRAGAPDNGGEVGDARLRDVDFDRCIGLDEDRRAIPGSVARDGNAAAFDEQFDDRAPRGAGEVAADCRFGAFRKDDRRAALVAVFVGEAARELHPAAVRDAELGLERVSP